MVVNWGHGGLNLVLRFFWRRVFKCSSAHPKAINGHSWYHYSRLARHAPGKRGRKESRLEMNGKGICLLDYRYWCTDKVGVTKKGSTISAHILPLFMDHLVAVFFELFFYFDGNFQNIFAIPWRELYSPSIKVKSKGKCPRTCSGILKVWKSTSTRIKIKLMYKIKPHMLWKHPAS